MPPPHKPGAFAYAAENGATGLVQNHAGAPAVLRSSELELSAQQRTLQTVDEGKLALLVRGVAQLYPVCVHLRPFSPISRSATR
jgi:hypothetical protein